MVRWQHALVVHRPVPYPTLAARSLMHLSWIMLAAPFPLCQCVSHQVLTVSMYVCRRSKQ